MDATGTFTDAEYPEPFQKLYLELAVASAAEL